MTREIEARLRISALDKTGGVFRSVAGKMDQVNRRAEALNQRQAIVARSSAAMFATMARFAAPAVLTAGARAALVDFAAVERQMTRIGITAQATKGETDDAFTVMQQLAKGMAMPLDQAVTALDTLVSSGMSLKEAMDFLPSVLATAQASGAATEDIANTAIKAASALKLQTGEMQKAFDIMVAGGKEGQFELKDMAAYIPELANSFASLGYSGQDGLKTLIALLQTIREDTGSASAAATQAQNIFGKMYSSDTAKKFSQFGIDLRKELKAAAAEGEDAVAAFVRLSKEAIDGDLSKLPLLFTDQEFRLGMQSLITSAESYKKFVDAVNSTKVDGTVLRDLKTVTDDTQASIDRMAGSWEKLKMSFGGVIADPASDIMDSITSAQDKQEAIRRGLKKRGMSVLEGEWWQFTNGNDEDAINRVAAEGGFQDPEWRKRNMQGPALPADWGKDFPGGGTGQVPVPGTKPGQQTTKPRFMAGPWLPAGWTPPETSLRPDQANTDLAAIVARNEREAARGEVLPVTSKSAGLSVPSGADWKEALKIDAGITGLKQSGEEAGQSVADGGAKAKDAIGEGAALIKVAGVDVGAAITSAAEQLLQAAREIARAKGAAFTMPSGGGGGVNANTGRSMPASAGQPWDGDKS